MCDDYNAAFDTEIIERLVINIGDRINDDQYKCLVDDINDGRDKVFPIGDLDEPDVDDIIDSIKRDVCFKPPSPTDALTPTLTAVPTDSQN